MDQQTERKLNSLIVNAIRHQSSCVILSKGAQYDDVRRIIRIFMRRHPEIFWFSHQYYFDEPTSTLYLKYNFTRQKRLFYAEQIENAVRFNFQPECLMHLSDLAKVAYVYKWIVYNTTYNVYSSFNQTIYSVLINRNSVCTGYAKTAQYLLGLIGIESELIFGKFHGDGSAKGRHTWNIVKIDGDWYHVDFCLADPTLQYLLNSCEAPIENNGLLWNFFCRSTEYILGNRSIEFIESYPQCSKSITQKFEITLLTPQKRFVVCKSESGTTSRVYLDSFDKACVLKAVIDHHDLVGNESWMLYQLKDSGHVVKFRGRIQEGILLEQLIPWSELLNSHYYHPNETHLKNILIQLAKGLIECKDRGISYSDIHYNNVFVANDGTYKWGDFGIGFHYRENGLLPPQLIGVDGIALGSRWFMSPETYKDKVFTESSAIYSLAMLAYFVMNNMRPPFWTETEPENIILKKLHSNLSIPLPVNWSSYNSLAKIVCKILNAKPSGRISKLEELISILNIDESAQCFNDTGKYDIDAIPFTILETDIEVSDSFANTMQCAPECYSDNKAGLNHRDRRHRDLELIWKIGVIDEFAWTNGLGTMAHAMKEAVAPDCCEVTRRNLSNVHRDKTATYVPKNNRIENDGYSESTTKKNGIISYVSKLAGRISRLGKKDKLDRELETIDWINACVYAPYEVWHRRSFIIRVYMYLPHERDEVDSKIQEIDPNAVKKEYKPLDLPVKSGDKLTVQLELSDGVKCRETIKTVIWQGHYIDCSFMARVYDLCNRNIEGSVYVLVNDVPAGEMLFTIDVVSDRPNERYTKIESHQFSKIFISYAHQDESQVRGIAEGCRMLGKDYFFDRHTLQAGDIFKDKILNYIDQADLFVLCWSKNAAESEWVQIERKHALRLIRQGNTNLTIYPLCLRPEAPLPLDMSDKYNFGKL